MKFYYLNVQFQGQRVNIDTKDYISNAVSGTKVSMVDVFSCEFPTSQTLKSLNILIELLCITTELTG